MFNPWTALKERIKERIDRISKALWLLVGLTAGSLMVAVYHLLYVWSIEATIILALIVVIILQEIIILGLKTMTSEESI